jgi:outer membrane protein assembly factor BamE (lipoprotein component of BamABCDE complex)
MTRIAGTLTCLCLAVVLTAGCAFNPGVKPWWMLQEAQFLQLQPGKDSADRIRQALGSPLSVTEFSRQGEVVWDYRFIQGTQIWLAWVYFDMEGTYKRYTAQQDPATYSTND